MSCSDSDLWAGDSWAKLQESSVLRHRMKSNKSSRKHSRFSNSSSVEKDHDKSEMFKKNDVHITREKRGMEQRMFVTLNQGGDKFIHQVCSVILSFCTPCALLGGIPASFRSSPSGLRSSSLVLLVSPFVWSWVPARLLAPLVVSKVFRFKHTKSKETHSVQTIAD